MFKTFSHRSTSLALALALTLALLGGIDRLAQHEGATQVMMAAQPAASA
jgi:hypothetical protein